MYPRLFHVVLLLALLCGCVFFTIHLASYHRVEPALPMIFVPVFVVVGWLTWQAIARLSRYGGKFLLIRRKYQLHLYHDRDAILGPIEVEGEALLIVKCSLSASQIRLVPINTAEEEFIEKFNYGARQVEFVVADVGRWTAMLAVRAPRIGYSSFQLTLGPREEGYFATLEVELRGLGRVFQFPDHADEVVRGFPVVVKGDLETSGSN